MHSSLQDDDIRALSFIILYANVYLHWTFLAQQIGPTADLEAINDRLINTCVPLRLISNGDPFILQGNPSISYNYLTAHVLVRNMSNTFASHSCKGGHSMMMTHARNVSARKCGPICGILNGCKLQNIIVGNAVVEYIFFCHCKDNLCSELLISVTHFDIHF